MSNETNRYNQYCMGWSLIELGKGNLNILIQYLKSGQKRDRDQTR